MSEIALSVQTPCGSVHVVADGSAPLALLLPALADAAGATDLRGLRWWDGGRALDPGSTRSLDDLGVLAGSRLTLT